MTQSFNVHLFALFNQWYRLPMRFWTWVYTPFLGAIGSGSRLQRVDFLRCPHRIFLGKNVLIGRYARIEAIVAQGSEVFTPTISIGDGTTIEPYAHIAAASEVTIGCNVLMASRVYISDHDHTYEDHSCHVGSQPLRVAPVRIGDFVWLGENVMVLKGTTIGHHAVIGANSVVTHDISPYSVAVGSPARVVKVRAAPESISEPVPASGNQH